MAFQLSLWLWVLVVICPSSRGVSEILSLHYLLHFYQFALYTLDLGTLLSYSFKGSVSRSFNFCVVTVCLDIF